MISERELERRLEQARQNRGLEPAFFRCLLDAVVYAHAPVSDDHPRLRLIQFRHPDGFYVVPFFTSQAKALLVAGSTARLIKLTGRELFEGTPGATFMLNPNDGACVLYPEEIAALLESGTVARVETIKLEADTPFLIVEEATLPAWLLPALTTLYEGLPFVEVAYWLKVAPPDRPKQCTFLIALGVGQEHAERAARATITVLQASATSADIPIDLTSFDPTQGLPTYLCHTGAQQFFGPRT